ncbi:hypothetical protein D3C78_855290 [compost metagenome]
MISFAKVSNLPLQILRNNNDFTLRICLYVVAVRRLKRKKFRHCVELLVPVLLVFRPPLRLLVSLLLRYILQIRRPGGLLYRLASCQKQIHVDNFRNRKNHTIAV